MPAATAAKKSQSLLESTYRLLDECDLSYREIAEGADVDRNWVAKFVQRAIDEPGVMKVQRVHDFLASKARSKCGVNGFHNDSPVG